MGSTAARVPRQFKSKSGARRHLHVGYDDCAKGMVSRIPTACKISCAGLCDALPTCRGSRVQTLHLPAKVVPCKRSVKANFVLEQGRHAIGSEARLFTGNTLLEGTSRKDGSQRTDWSSRREVALGRFHCSTYAQCERCASFALARGVASSLRLETGEGLARRVRVQVW